MPKDICKYAERWDTIYLCKNSRLASKNGILPCPFNVPNEKACNRLRKKYRPTEIYVVKFSHLEKLEIELIYKTYKVIMSKIRNLEDKVDEIIKNHPIQEMRETKNIHLVRAYNLKKKIRRLLEELG